MEPDFLSYEQPPQQTSFKTHLIELFETLVVFGAIITVIYWLVAQPHKVSGLSMYPNFNDADYIITDKLSYKFNPPQRGDIIVFKNPRDLSQDFIKRIIGIPGDTVRVENNHVFLNGKQLAEPFLKPDVITEPHTFIPEAQDVSVPPDKYIVFGDNRTHSSDSREWGYVEKSEIIGKVFLRYWPQNSIGLFPAAYAIKQ